MEYKEGLKQGEEAAKIKSRKQAVVTGLLQAVIIAVAIFNDFSFAGKLIIFVALSLILGA